MLFRSVLRAVSDRLAVAEGMSIPDIVPADFADDAGGRPWRRPGTYSELTPVG